MATSKKTTKQKTTQKAKRAKVQPTNNASVEPANEQNTKLVSDESTIIIKQDKFNIGIEDEKPFTKSIDEMDFTEATALEGIVVNEITWLEQQAMYLNENKNSYYRVNSIEYRNADLGIQQYRLKAGKLMDLANKLHHKVTNYILDQWTK